jgi:hypothetical protein
MQRAIFVFLSLSLLVLGAARVDAAAPPIGAHDPEALTCNAPELVPVSNQRGWPVCVQNDMLGMLSTDGGATLAHAPMADQPTGEGNPDAITCRPRQALTGSRTMGAEACARNSFWAKLAVGGCILTPGNRTIFRSGTTKVLGNREYCYHMQGRNGLMPRFFF